MSTQSKQVMQHLPSLDSWLHHPLTPSAFHLEDLFHSLNDRMVIGVTAGKSGEAISLCHSFGNGRKREGLRLVSMPSSNSLLLCLVQLHSGSFKEWKLKGMSQRRQISELCHWLFSCFCEKNNSPKQSSGLQNYKVLYRNW